MGTHSKLTKKEKKSEESEDVTVKEKSKHEKKSKKDKNQNPQEEEKQEEESKAEKKSKKHKQESEKEISEDKEQKLSKKEKKEKKEKKGNLETQDKKKESKEASEQDTKEEQKEEKIKSKKHKRKRSEDSSEDIKKKLKQEEKEVIIKPKDEHEIFVGGFSYDVKEDDLRQLFGKKVLRLNLLKRQNGKSRGIAFVTFKKEKYVDKACKLNGTDFMGKAIKVIKSNHQQMPKPPKLPETNKIFIGNVNFSTQENSIRSFFERCGNIKKLIYGKNQDGQSKGFCHIEFSSSLAVEKALRLTGGKLDGKQIRIDVAKQQN